MSQEPVWCTPEQVESLRNACLTDAFASYQQERNDAIVALLYDTGIRVGELVQVRVSNLQLDDSRLILPADIQKDSNRGSPHTVRIELGKYGADSTRALRTHLKHRTSDSEYVFASRQSETMTTQAVRNLVKKAAVKADVRPHKPDGSRGEPEDIHPHAFRHSIAYRIMEVEGGTFDDVKKRLRHGRLATTEDTYSHFLTV
jgi:integrase